MATRPGVCGTAIGWVMAGGESGPWRAPDPARPGAALRDQCTRTGTPFYWNDWGAAMPDAKAEQDAAPLHGAPPRRAS
jgi:protein gp37